MKRVIRNGVTRAFLKRDGEWTADLSCAQNFADLKSVVGACEQHGLADVELVLIMGSEPSSDYDIVLPLCSVRNTEQAPLIR